MDIILGMDWLTSNHVVLDCFNQVVNFASEPVNLSKVSLNPLVSTLCLSQSMLNGLKGYVLLLSSTSKLVFDLTSIPKVYEFLNVFPYEIAYLPLDREVEFSIDLVPGTGPISIVPYRVSLLELKELKAQLEDLIVKRFVRPSALSFGAFVLLVKKKDESMRLCIDYQQVSIA